MKMRVMVMSNNSKHPITPMSGGQFSRRVHTKRNILCQRASVKEWQSRLPPQCRFHV